MGKKLVRSVRFWVVMLLPVSVCLTVCARYIGGFANAYFDCFYRYVSSFFHQATGVLPFSAGEVLVLAVPVLTVVYTIFVIVRTVKSKGKRMAVVRRGSLNLLCAASAALFLFTTNCGINYYRTTYGELSGLNPSPSAKTELYDTCVWLAKQASSLREHLPEDEQGVMMLSADPRTEAAEAVNRLSGNNPVTGTCSTVKSVMLSRGMSYLNITGVYFPWTFEANANTDIPAWSQPSTMCHELAHVRGFMQEQDANFIAFQACVESGSEELAYSGTMMALIYGLNALGSSSDDVWSYISDGVRRDMAAQSEYWAQFETPVAEAAAAVNDSYLKSNAQQEGTRSYGMMLGLVIAYYQKHIAAEVPVGE